MCKYPHKNHLAFIFVLGNSASTSKRDVVHIIAIATVKNCLFRNGPIKCWKYIRIGHICRNGLLRSIFCVNYSTKLVIRWPREAAAKLEERRKFDEITARLLCLRATGYLILVGEQSGLQIHRQQMAFRHSHHRALRCSRGDTTRT